MTDLDVRSRIRELWTAGSAWGASLGAVSGGLLVLVTAFAYGLGSGNPDVTLVIGVVVFSGIGLIIGSVIGLLVGSATGLAAGMLLSLLLEQRVGPHAAMWITVVVISAVSGVAWALVWLPMIAVPVSTLYPLARSIRRAL